MRAQTKVQMKFVLRLAVRYKRLEPLSLRHPDPYNIHKDFITTLYIEKKKDFFFYNTHAPQIGGCIKTNSFD